MIWQAVAVPPETSMLMEKVTEAPRAAEGEEQVCTQLTEGPSSPPNNEESFTGVEAADMPACDGSEGWDCPAFIGLPAFWQPAFNTKRGNNNKLTILMIRQ